MAEHLGFYVISTKLQYIPSSFAGTSELAEVAAELAYNLTPIPATPPPALVRHFTTTIPSVAARTAERWRISAEALGGHFAALRNERLRHEQRNQALHRLRLDATETHDDLRRPW
jgi:hypothetical protein